MGLPHELMHLGVRSQVHHEVDRRVFDTPDAARERRVVTGEILEQGWERVRPGVLALVDSEDVVAVGE